MKCCVIGSFFSYAWRCVLATGPLRHGVFWVGRRGPLGKRAIGGRGSGLATNRPAIGGTQHRWTVRTLSVYSHT